MPTDESDLQQRTRALQLHGLLAHWQELEARELVVQWIQWEEEKRAPPQ